MANSQAAAEIQPGAGWDGHAVYNLPVFSPLGGAVVPLSEAPDARISGGILGKGLAIRPSTGAVAAPFDASIVAIDPTHRSIALRHTQGLEVLIQTGVTAGRPSGRPFNLTVSTGQKVRAGDLLIEFDDVEINAAGSDGITRVTVLNGTQYPEIMPLASGQISQGEALFMALARKPTTDA